MKTRSAFLTGRRPRHIYGGPRRPQDEAPLPSDYVPESQRHLFAPGSEEALLRELEAKLRAAMACAVVGLLATTGLVLALCRRSRREVTAPALLV